MASDRKIYPSVLHDIKAAAKSLPKDQQQAFIDRQTRSAKADMNLTYKKSDD